VEIINNRANLQAAIFRILFAHYKKHYWESEIAFIKADDIAQILEKQGIRIYDVKGQIRRKIQKTQRKIYNRFNVDIVITEKWKGYGISSNLVLKKGSLIFQVFQS
jgi:S-adenosylhomocysteine hydrolase